MLKYVVIICALAGVWQFLAHRKSDAPHAAPDVSPAGFVPVTAPA